MDNIIYDYYEDNMSLFHLTKYNNTDKVRITELTNNIRDYKLQLPESVLNDLDTLIERKKRIYKHIDDTYIQYESEYLEKFELNDILNYYDQQIDQIENELKSLASKNRY